MDKRYYIPCLFVDSEDMSWSDGGGLIFLRFEIDPDFATGDIWCIASARRWDRRYWSGCTVGMVGLCCGDGRGSEDGSLQT